MAINHKSINIPLKWRGLNLLRHALMSPRDKTNKKAQYTMSQSFTEAYCAGKRRIAETLLEKNTEVDVNYTNENGDTAMHHAAAKGYLDIIKALIAKRADIDYENHQGITPLYMSVKYRQKQTALFLIQEGVRTDIADYEGNTLYHVLVLVKKICYLLYLMPA